MEDASKTDGPTSLSDAQIAREKERWEILYGGMDLLIIRRIATPGQDDELKDETVKVRKVPITEMGKLAGSFGNLDREIETYLGLKPEYVATITDESKLDIMREGRRLNVKSFAAWFSLQTQAAEVMTGKRFDSDKIIREAIQTVTASSNAR